ncbi:MAG: helix-turn-helix domain-containing protein [Magnetococcales bacterium]|nr:helix-turn-helix domain-containing protein [Magnetococcales bacterium]NGZ06902.1 helix-turn-helix domain-containing protein [Magnetococcales bacterium]
MNPLESLKKNQSDGDVAECPDRMEVACEQCGLFGFLRLFEQMGIASLSQFLTRQIPMAKGARLFEAEQPFHGIYAVKKGSFKSCALLDASGEQQITGFYLPGELLGLDAIRVGVYGYHAVALEASSVCQLPFMQVEELGEHMAAFQEQVIQVLVDQVRHDQRQTLLVGRRSAEERLGAFLLNLSERLERHGFGTGEGFRLPMLQNDIANYLGLSMETVSRTLRSFREQELVSLQGKWVRILNPTCLRSITQYCATPLPGG